MTPLTPEEFYQANISRVKEYVRVFVAREIRVGEEGLNETMTIPGPGYELRSGNGSYLGRRFMTAAAFAAKTVPIDSLALPMPKNDPAAEGLEDITPVTEGERVVIHADDLTDYTRPYQTTTVHDGFLLKRNGRQIYMSNYDLASRYKYAGEKYETRKEHVVTLKSVAPVRGILLDQATTFLIWDTIGAKRKDTYPANTFLYPDPQSPFGYSLEIMSRSANMELRVLADFHAVAAEKQAKLNARAPRILLKP